MYFNSISALAHKFYGDPLLPLAEIDLLDKYIADLATPLGWFIRGSSKEERQLLADNQEFVRLACRDLNRQLHCINAWAKSRGTPFKPTFTARPKENARTRDLFYIFSLEDTTHNQLAESAGVSTHTVKEATNVVQKYLNTTLLTYHRAAHYQGWWIRTEFSRDPIVWDMLKEVYEKGEEVKKKALEVTRRGK